MWSVVRLGPFLVILRCHSETLDGQSAGSVRSHVVDIDSCTSRSFGHLPHWHCIDKWEGLQSVFTVIRSNYCSLSCRYREYDRGNFYNSHGKHMWSKMYHWWVLFVCARVCNTQASGCSACWYYMTIYIFYRKLQQLFTYECRLDK